MTDSLFNPEAFEQIPGQMSLEQSNSALGIGDKVHERAYPGSFVGTVTGFAPDGWTFVRWAAGRVLSHAPGELIRAEVER